MRGVVGLSQAEVSSLTRRGLELLAIHVTGMQPRPLASLPTRRANPCLCTCPCVARMASCMYLLHAVLHAGMRRLIQPAPFSCQRAGSKSSSRLVWRPLAFCHIGWPRGCGRLFHCCTAGAHAPLVVRDRNLHRDGFARTVARLQPVMLASTCSMLARSSGRFACARRVASPGAVLAPHRRSLGARQQHRVSGNIVKVLRVRLGGRAGATRTIQRRECARIAPHARAAADRTRLPAPADVRSARAASSPAVGGGQVCDHGAVPSV